MISMTDTPFWAAPPLKYTAPQKREGKCQYSYFHHFYEMSAFQSKSKQGRTIELLLIHY
jgi:hypothetical protein